MPNDDTIFLKTKVDVLSFFNEDQLRRVTPDIERNTYSRGNTVLLKGEITTGFYIIKKGRVTVSQKQRNGSVLDTDLRAGDFFGEISILEDTAATATIRAAEDGTEILTIPTGSFQKLLEMQPLLKKALFDKATVRRATPPA